MAALAWISCNLLKSGVVQPPQTEIQYVILGKTVLK